MKLVNSADDYGLISKLFHWVMAALMIATYVLGISLENNYEYYYEILMFHNTLGLLILFLAIFRLSWKFINIRPKPILKNKILINVAKTNYFLFYSIFFLQPISGYLLTNLQGDAVMFLNFELVEILSHNSDLMYIFKIFHEYSSNVLLVLFFIHTGAALMHHFVFRDRTLKRMTFSGN